MRIRRLSTAAVLAVALGAGALADASPAFAVPSGCGLGYPDPSHITSQCQAGTGEHRPVCVYPHWQGGGPITSVGPWTPVGGVSSAWCPTNSTYAYVDTR